MRDPNRIEPLVNMLKLVWEANPDLRLGQLLIAVAAKGGKRTIDLFGVEDNIFEDGLFKILSENKLD